MEVKPSLKVLRISKGYSQEDMANLLGMSRATYISRECGRSRFDASEAAKLVKVLEMDYLTANELLFDGALPEWGS